VDVRNHQVSAWSQHSGEFGHHRCERGDVSQCEGARHQVDRVIADRQRVQGAQPELGVRHPVPGVTEHLGRAVHSDDAMATRGQTFRPATGAARRVQGIAGGQRLDDLVDDRFVEIERAVGYRAVVPRRATGGLRRADLPRTPGRTRR
jgi:hypothetical protein